jgi:hypothetical protein
VMEPEVFLRARCRRAAEQHALTVDVRMQLSSDPPGLHTFGLYWEAGK